MKSRSFLGDFVERGEILPELMAVESWSAELGEIVLIQSNVTLLPIPRCARLIGIDLRRHHRRKLTRSLP